MSDMQIQSVLAEMRALSARAAGNPEAAEATQGPSFTDALKQSISEVNETQQHAGDLSVRFQKGDPTVELADVMVSIQKAGLEFEAVVQVRNRLVSAYREIMNMQV